MSDEDYRRFWRLCILQDATIGLLASALTIMWTRELFVGDAALSEILLVCLGVFVSVLGIGLGLYVYLEGRGEGFRLFATGRDK